MRLHETCLVPRPSGRRESVLSPPTQPGNVDRRQGESIDLDVLIGAHVVVFPANRC